MQNNHDQPRPAATLAEVKAAAEELLARVAGTDLTDTDLFPHGITRLNVHLKAGEVEVQLELEGPERGHDHDHEDEWEDDVDGLFDDDEKD